MIPVKNDSILNANQKIIAQHINCYDYDKCSNVAMAIIRKFPNVKREHRLLCEKNKSNDLLGNVQFIDCKTKIVANLYVQRDNDYSNSVGRSTDYNALEIAIRNLFNYSRLNNIDVALPYKLGCDIGGGNWTIVKKIIEKNQEETGANVTFYKYIKPKL